MKKLTLLALLFPLLLLHPHSAEAAIAFDAKTTSSTGAGSSSITWSHTTSGSNRILFVGITTLNFSTGSPGVTATYNGVSMTPIATDVISFATNNYRLHVFYLVNPASGAHNVVATATTGTGIFTSAAVSYTGVDQASPLLTSNSVNTTSSGSSITVGLTTSGTAWWGMFGSQADTPFTSVSSNLSSLRANPAETGEGDSNGDISPQTGNAVMNFTGGTRGGGGVAFAFKAVSTASFIQASDF